MINLGIVRPGSTIRIPFSTFDKDDGSSITATNFAVGDILVYKDGSTTERASTSGYTATTDFDSKTGKQLIVIDLSDNTTAGFWSAGSEYVVAVDAITVDAVTTGGWAARFVIGHPNALFSTTIATLASQTSFTLTTGPAEDDALNGMWVHIHDVASAVQCGQAQILDYTGSTKTVTLAAGTTFTAAATDNISIMGLMPLQPAVTGRTLGVDASGRVDVGSTMGVAEVARITGTASGGGSNYIDFTASTVTTQQCPVGGTVRITSGTGAFQWLPITTVTAAGGYVTRAYGPTGWTWPVTNANNTSVYQIEPGPGYAISPITSVWSDAANPTREITGGNVSEMNSVAVIGSGTVASPWRGA